VEVDGHTILLHRVDISFIAVDEAIVDIEKVQIQIVSRGDLFLCVTHVRVRYSMKASSPTKDHVVIGKDELIHQVAARAGLNLKETSKVIDAFTEVVREDVARGHEVRLMGFGTWNLRDVAARRVKSIRGGDQITIPARKRVGFSVGAVLSQSALGSSPLFAPRTDKRSNGETKMMRNGSER
jgi:DNA-binding protein HU-beta